MNRMSIGGVCLLVGGLVALGWWLAHDDARAGAARGLEPAATPELEEVLSAGATAQLASARASDLASPNGQERARLAEAAPVTASDTRQPPGLTGVLVDVLVVEGRSELPTIGAEVRGVSRSLFDPRWPRSNAIVLPDPADFPALSPAVVTDARGIARIDTSVLPGVVSAQLGDRYGAIYHSGGSQPIKIVLGPDGELSIEVVDEGETPIPGVPVGLRRAPTGPAVPEVWRGVTEGPKGLARVVHAHQAFGRFKGLTRSFAHLDVPGCDELSEPVDLAALPSVPVHLHLPECGSVVLRLHDSTGRPVMPELVTLAVRSNVPTTERTRGDKESQLEFLPRTFDPPKVEVGRAVYPFVGLGLELEVRASRTTGLHVMKSGPGPSRAGEVVTFDLDLGAEPAQLVLRLVDRTGRPVVKRDVRLSVMRSQEFRSGGSSLRTDEMGRVRVAAPTEVVGEVELEVDVRVSPTALEPGGIATLVRTLRIEPGDNDLGDVTLNEQPRLAAGRILDDGGAPVARATVRLEALLAERGSERWVAHPEVQAESKADGSFDLWGPDRTGRIRLRASRTGHVQREPTEITSGSVGVEIVVERASEIQGYVTLDDLGAKAKIWVLFERPEDTREQRMTFGLAERTLVMPDGRFRIQNLRSGPGSLLFKVDGAPNAVFTMRSLVLRPGDTLTKPGTRIDRLAREDRPEHEARETRLTRDCAALMSAGGSHRLGLAAPRISNELVVLKAQRGDFRDESSRPTRPRAASEHARLPRGAG